MNFIPNPGKYNKKDFNNDTDTYFRRIMLRAHFKNDEPYQYEGFSNKNNSSWTPKNVHHSIKTYMQAVQNDLNESSRESHKDRPNITSGEMTALAALKERDDIIISKADKGGAVVIQDVTAYLAEAEKQLSDTVFYERQDRDLTNEHAQLINDTIDQLANEKVLPEKAAKALKVSNPKTSRFYMLPKVHKKGNPGRPIISAIDNHTSSIAAYVDHHLQPLAEQLPSYVKDSGAFLRKVNSIKEPLPKDAILVTMDVSALFTSIPHRDGLNAVAHALESRTSPSIPTRVILKFLHMILYLNNFIFNDTHYLQKKGCAMGSKCSGSYADLFMGKLEKDHIYHRIRGRALCYTRFKDDVFLIWTAGEKSLLEFFEEINRIHGSIKFECKYARDHIAFLDILVHLTPEGIKTTLYKKPTDRNAYLHYTSYHPRKQVQNIPYGQFLRAKKICSDPKDAKNSMREIESNLRGRGYPSKETTTQMDKTKDVPREALLIDKPKRTSRRTPFTTTYNKHLPPIQGIINKHWPILHTNKDIAPAFTEPPVLAYRRNKNLRNLIGQVHLSRGRKILPKKQPKIVGCSPCLASNKNKCCRQVTSSKHFKSDRTGEQFDIRHKLNCRSRNTIYLGYCVKCPFNQYVGKSEPPAHKRINTHRSDVHSTKGNSFDKHFALPGHSYDHDARFVLIEQIRNEEILSKEEIRSILEDREDFWMVKLRTLAPDGHNDRLNNPMRSKIHNIVSNSPREDAQGNTTTRHATTSASVTQH